MKFLGTFLFAIVGYVVCDGLHAQRPDSNPIQLTIANQNVSDEYDLNLSARLISKWKKPVAVPANLTWGQLSVPDPAFILVELQRKVGRKYKEVLLNANIDNIGPFNVDSLYKGDSAESHDFTLAGLAKFTMGDYRVRVLCRLSAFNPGMKNIYSDWVYFKCVKDIPYRFVRTFESGEEIAFPVTP